MKNENYEEMKLWEMKNNIVNKFLGSTSFSKEFHLVQKLSMQIFIMKITLMQFLWLKNIMNEKLIK